MASDHFVSSVSEQAVPEVEREWAAARVSTVHGADIRFHGVVRDLEEGREISGIDYTCYREMAEAELERIGAEMGEEFPEHLAEVHHRIGFVAAGEASLLIRVRTGHSAEAYAISREYLRRIKERVPVWKRAVFADE